MKQPFRVHEEYMWIGQKNLMKLFAYQMLEPSHFQDLPQMNVHCVDPKLNFPHLLQQTIYGISVHHLSYHSADKNVRIKYQERTILNNQLPMITSTCITMATVLSNDPLRRTSGDCGHQATD